MFFPCSTSVHHARNRLWRLTLATRHIATTASDPPSRSLTKGVEKPVLLRKSTFTLSSITKKVEETAPKNQPIAQSFTSPIHDVKLTHELEATSPIPIVQPPVSLSPDDASTYVTHNSGALEPEAVVQSRTPSSHDAETPVTTSHVDTSFTSQESDAPEHAAQFLVSLSPEDSSGTHEAKVPEHSDLPDITEEAYLRKLPSKLDDAPTSAASERPSWKGQETALPQPPVVTSEGRIPWIDRTRYKVYSFPLFKRGWEVGFEEVAVKPDAKIAYLKRTFSFSSFETCSTFFAECSEYSKKENHYPINMSISTYPSPTLTLQLYTRGTETILPSWEGWKELWTEENKSSLNVAGITLRDIRLALLLERRFEQEYVPYGKGVAETMARLEHLKLNGGQPRWKKFKEYLLLYTVPSTGNKKVPETGTEEVEQRKVDKKTPKKKKLEAAWEEAIEGLLEKSETEEMQNPFEDKDDFDPGPGGGGYHPGRY